MCKSHSVRNYVNRFKREKTLTKQPQIRILDHCICNLIYFFSVDASALELYC